MRIAAVGLFLCLGAPQSPPSPIGLLGHWKGDDAGAVDASWSGFAGTCAAGTTVSKEVAPVKFPNPGSFDLDGKTGMVTVPDAPGLQRPWDFTLSFWKRKTAHVNDWIRIVGKGNGAQRNFGLWEAPGESGQLKFQIYGPNGGSVLELDSPGMPTLNVWHHVVCTVSVNACALYVDGKPTAAGQRTGPPGLSGDPLTFGHAGYHAFFPGQIDDIRLYDRALSMSEIAYLAAGQGPPAPPADLKASGTTLTWTPSATVPPAGTATTYAVKRSKTPGAGYATVAAGLSSATWTDPAPEAGATLHYVVTALNTGGESGTSNEVSLTAPR